MFSVLHSGTAAKHCLRRLDPKDRRFGEQITYSLRRRGVLGCSQEIVVTMKGRESRLGAHITKRIKWTTFRLSEEARRQLSSTIGL